MPRRVRQGALWSLLVAAATAHAGGPPEVAPGAAFGPGETTTWAVSYLGVVAGTAKVTVGLPMSVEDEWVWPVLCEAQSAPYAAVWPVSDRFVTYWSPALGRSVGFDFFADENRKRRREKARFHGRSADMTRQKDGSAPWDVSFEVPDDVLDLAATALKARTVPLAVGQQRAFQVFTGKKTFTLEAEVEAKETIATGLGPRDVYRVSATTDFSGALKAKKRVLLYFTADARQVPVRVEADLALGTLVADAVQYHPGRGS